MPKRKANGVLIPPLEFVGDGPVGKAPFNPDFVQCTAKYPRVRAVTLKEIHPWIEPHFDYSQRLSLRPQGTTLANEKTSTTRKCGATSNQCPLVPPKTPNQKPLCGEILVCESPQR
uniref:Transposase n=1 Tax=Mesocestoides corti TaxID=53468 RepID=A0A5K3EYV4_MESCO